MPVSFLIAVVIYETPPAQSETLRSLRGCRGLSNRDTLLVIDHSSIDQEAACLRMCQGCSLTVRYHHDPANPPLGISYNRALAEHLGGHTYYVLLDQDSHLPPEFFETVRRCAHEYGEPSALAPNILAAARIASPCWSAFGWGRSWRRPREGWHSWHFCSAITSATCIHRRVFVEFRLRYSETLVFYGIDTDFFRRLGRIDSRFLVLPMSLQHSLSFDDSSLAVKASKLDQIFTANRQIYSDSGILSRYIVSTLEYVLRLKYALKHRSLVFLTGRARRQLNSTTKV